MDRWWVQIPGLKAVDEAVCLRLLASAKPVNIPSGVTVVRQGDRPHNYALLLKGCVRVQSLSDSGREVTLYRINPGESCVLTTSCLLAQDAFPAEAVTEHEVEAMLIEEAAFRTGLATSTAFRDFVFWSFGNRLADLIVLVQDITSRRLDVRLADRLLQQADDAHVVHASHMELAAEVGSVREVVSRQLKGLERRNLVRLRHRCVEIVDSGALRRFIADR